MRHSPFSIAFRLLQRFRYACRRWPGRATAALLALTSSVCFAHAVVVESTPADGAALREAPKAVELRFNVRVEQSLARASLRGAGPQPLALTALRTDTPRTDRLTVPLPALKPGEYELRYHVLAIDGHTTQGILRFQILP